MSVESSPDVSLSLHSADGKNVDFYSLPWFINSIESELKGQVDQSRLADIYTELSLLYDLCVYIQDRKTEELPSLRAKVRYALETKITQTSNEEIKRQSSITVFNSARVIDFFEWEEKIPSDPQGTILLKLLFVNELTCLYYIFSIIQEGERNPRRLLQGYQGIIKRLKDSINR